MTFRSVGAARWCAHVNGVHAPRELRDWLTDTVSLTQKLTGCSRQFRVQRLRQQRELCLADEFAAVGLARRVCVQEREVLLRCDERPMVFAHTIVPLSATATDWPFFGTLGERSLGTTLFGDPRVVRGALQFARLPAVHPLVRRAQQAIGNDAIGPLYARRCLYKRKKGVLLVTEVFLPAITEIELLQAPEIQVQPQQQIIERYIMNDSLNTQSLTPTLSRKERVRTDAIRCRELRKTQ